MKNGTLYARRLKKAYTRVRQSAPPPEVPEPDDPLRRLAIGVLGVTCGDAPAERAVDRLLSQAVDWNEVRVSTPLELHLAIGDSTPCDKDRCEQLLTALQSVFDRVNALSLDHLKDMGRREARQYLEKLKGVDEYAAAGVLLWSLGGHAIPVSDPLLKVLKDAELAHPEATRAEVQAFLERHIAAAEAKEFCLYMRGVTPAKLAADGAARRSGKKTKKTAAKSARRRSSRRTTQ
jgi:endonuclease III